MPEDLIHIHRHENPDSIEIGTPSRGGALKIYGDFSNVESFKIKILNAVKIRNFTQAEMDGGEAL
jgi:hypothetical protein